jgi:arylsulfatase A-like enzyme
LKNSKSGLLAYLLLLTGIFALLEVSYFIQRGGIYLSEFTLVTSHLDIPLKIIPGVIFFLVAQLLVHLSFTTLVWAAARLVGVALKCHWRTVQTLGFNFWIFGIVAVLVANQHFFPNSQFAALTDYHIDTRVLEFVWSAFLIICALIILLAGIGFIKTLPVLSRLLIGVVFISSTAGFMSSHQSMVRDASTPEKPNIIIIGIDALRPDYLGFFGADVMTPNLDAFLKQSAAFGTAMTPQARTFPAWMSILTGKYPKHVNARYDLQDKSLLNIHDDTLPQILRQAGYTTVFATDETRFSNIDTSFGFDSTVTPPVGVNDFLLGSLNDFPMSNLIVNTPLGKWLFPNSYGNRPAYITYDPDSFLKMLKPALTRPRDKPLFLAVHFCLPHFPYFWADYSFQDTKRAEVHYRFAVQRADQQVGDFLALLEQNGILKHSIVILLSDHGEALNLHGDRATDRDLYIAGSDNPKKIVPRYYPISLEKEAVNQSAGHGTDVLGLTQYHTVLAFRFYGVNAPRPRIVPDAVSLIDIKPTVLTLLGYASEQDDGVSLTPLLFPANVRASLPARHLFMESDFSPQAVRTVHPETSKILFEGIDFFKIDPITTQLVVKKSMGDLIISSKQYADFYGEWILALYPQPAGNMMPILVNLNSGLWTNDLSTAFALASPANVMLSSLKQFYGNELHIK